jgi:hypothetical protein
MTYTLCLIRNGRGMDFTRYVERTFRMEEAAWKWRNTQYRNVTILKVPGKVRKGDSIPFTQRCETFQ